MSGKGKRKYTFPEWETAFVAMEALSKKKPYAQRFRLEYYFYLVMTRSFGKKLKLFFFNWLGYASQLFFLLKHQVFSGNTLPEGKYVYLFLSDNDSFYRTLLPVADDLFARGTPTLILCPAKQLPLVRNRLPEHMHASLNAVETSPVQKSITSKILATLRAVLLSLWDTLWFVSKPLKGTVFLSPYFARFALGHYMTARDWKTRFRKDRAFFMAASDYWYWESILTTEAKGTNCRTAVLQHGILGDYHYPFFADLFLVWGQCETDTMVQEYGAEPERIIAIGSPAMDLAWKRIENEKLAQPLENRNTVCFLTQPFIKSRLSVLPYYKEAILWFCRYAEQDAAKSGRNYVIKLHPGDDASFYDFLPPHVSLVKDDLLPLLGRSRTMVNIDSTAVLESALCGAPAIQVFPKGHGGFFIDRSQKGLTLLTESEAEFNKVMDKLLNDPAFFAEAAGRAAAAAGYYFSNLGHASPAIASLASDWLQSK